MKADIWSKKAGTVRIMSRIVHRDQCIVNLKDNGMRPKSVLAVGTEKLYIEASQTDTMGTVEVNKFASMT
jgi:hypothetical protein